jgi:uncharacterized membrane-anchored protein
MRDKLVMTVVFIAVAFTFIGYYHIKRLAQEVSLVEKNIAALVETQKTLSQQVENLSKKVLISEKTMTFIESLTESLSKALKGSKVQKEKTENKKE